MLFLLSDYIHWLFIIKLEIHKNCFYYIYSFYNCETYQKDYYKIVSECLLFDTKWVIFQLYHGENKLHSMGWHWCSHCTRPTCFVEFLQCYLPEKEVHEKTCLSTRTPYIFFWANQSLFFLLNAVFLVEKLWLDSPGTRTHDLPPMLLLQ